MTADASTTRLLAIGGAHIDRRGQVYGVYVPAASNPGSMAGDLGGGAFNALRVAVQRGVSGSILSLRGGDAGGEEVAAAIEAAGIRDLSVCYLDRSTPSYTALLDSTGELIAALADMSLYDLGFPRQLSRRTFRDAAEEADVLLVDANLPEAALLRVAEAASDKPVFAIAVSPAKVVRLHAVAQQIDCVFLNRREAAALTGMDELSPTESVVAGLREAGFRRAAITFGSGPLHAYDEDGLFVIASPKAADVRDVTGAGDALAGATIAAMMRGLAFAEALREGMAAAMLAIASRRSVPEITHDGFAAALARIPLPAPATMESQ